MLPWFHSIACWLLTIWWLPFVHSFKNVVLSRQQRHSFAPHFSVSPLNHHDNHEGEWKLQHGLLLSSFTDGLLNNVAAQETLRHGLNRALLLEATRHVESLLQTSAKFSPCCGPTNLPALTFLEQLDDAVTKLDNDDEETDPLELFWNCFSQQSVLQDYPLVIRVAYIPTAMYALRFESQNTPGKQRQRARADAKQRRDELFRLVEQLMTTSSGTCILVQICTVDWDDGSVKQPQQSASSTGVSIDRIPASGKQVLREWAPHLVYVQGGNTFWLHHCMKQGNWDADLIALCRDQNTFYIGSSAGAILAGRWMQTACWKGWDDPRVVPGMEQYESWESIAGLNMIGDHSVFVHYDNELWSTLVQEKSRTIGGRLLTLRDDQAMHVNGRKRELNILSSRETPVVSQFTSTQR